MTTQLNPIIISGQDHLKVPHGTPRVLDLVLAERVRQAAHYGYGDKHDDRHTQGEIAAAAAAYALYDVASAGDTMAKKLWPWPDFYKPSKDDPIRNLIKAAALLVAEIERRQRSKETLNRPRRFRRPTSGIHPNGRAVRYQYGVYFPGTDLCISDMAKPGTGAPIDFVEWLDPIDDIPWLKKKDPEIISDAE